MECVLPDYYDLEEGEILEYELVSPESSPKIQSESNAWDDYTPLYKKEVYLDTQVTHKSRSRHSKRKKERCLEKYKVYDKYRKRTRKNAFDFDEARKKLLEKLKKQQEKDRLDKIFQFPIQQEPKTSEPEDVEMVLSDASCTNKSDQEVERNEEKNQETSENSGAEGEDETDLVKLRLTALASNRKKRKIESSDSACNFFNQEEQTLNMETLDDPPNGDNEMDKTELLLRAEALKTALLKKHQKRMMKLKGEKGTDEAVSSENDTVCHISAENTDAEENLEKSKSLVNEVKNESDSILKLDEVVFKENVQESDLNVKNEDQKPSNDCSDLVSDTASKKLTPRARVKKKRKKSNSLANSLKENDNIEAEEDDRTLRSQLLSDLLKKKPVSDAEKKSVLLDSVQKDINKPAVVVPLKRPPFAKNTSLKKVNVNASKKPVTVVAPAVPAVPKVDIQRIIVHLGSEDSSDDDFDFTSSEQSESAEPKKEAEKKESFPVEAPNGTKQFDESIQANYERSVELLLSQARKKIEGEMQKSTGDHLATPEAVYKHLPPSQRLEYIRLKQKIAERERLKNLKTTATGCKPVGVPSAKVIDKPRLEAPVKTIAAPQFHSPVLEKTVYTSAVKPSPKVSSPLKFTSPGRGPVKALNRANYGLKGSPVKAALSTSPKKYISPASKKSKIFQPSQQVITRPPSNQILLTKVKLFLKKIKIEKTIEKNYDREIVKLKNQLSLVEKKKSEQRVKVKKLSEEITKIYRSIEATEKLKQKSVAPKTEKALPAGKEVVNEDAGGSRESVHREDKPIAAIIKVEDKAKEAETAKETRTDGPASEPLPPAQKIAEYNSPLQAFAKVSNVSSRVDPNVEMCQFDLMGVCKDEECSYQHVRPS